MPRMNKKNIPENQGGVIIRRCLTIVEAYSFQAFLNGHGIKTVLVGDNDAATMRMGPVASGGIKIFVPKSQLAEAKSVSEQYDKLMTNNE